MTQIIREKKNKRLMLKLYQAKFRKSYQYCFLSKQIIVRLIFFARKWKYTNTALPLTLEGWGGGGGSGGAFLNQNLRNLKFLHSIPDLLETGNSAASK